MIALFGALAAAWAALTALHLRSRPRSGAVPFPSFQHLEGLAPKRRPALPLEEPLRWLMRVAALGLAAWALFLARGASRKPLVLLVEPGLQASAWDGAAAMVRASSRPALALTLRGDGPVVDATAKAAEAAERARRTLASCSATPMACLVRAGREIAGETILVSRLVGRAETYEGLGSFRYVRDASSVATDTAKPSPTPNSIGTGSVKVSRLGSSNAARVWTAALEAGAEGWTGGSVDIRVVDHVDVAKSAGGILVVPVTSASKGARVAAIGGVALGEDASLAAGVGALDLGSSMTLEPDAMARVLVPNVMSRTGDVIRVAATDEDLGRWAHGPVLEAMARIVLFEAGGSLRLDDARPGGSHRWKPDAPLGLADVAPGRYEREDGRVSIAVRREEETTAKVIADGALQARGGVKLDSLPPMTSSIRWPLLLLLAAIALRLGDVPRGGGLRILVPYTLGVGILSMLAFDGTFLRRPGVRRALVTSGSLSIAGAERDDSCERPGTGAPCVVTARAARPDDATGATNAIVFSAERPRVDLVSWEVPSEIRTGEAGLLRVTLDVRRAAGRDVTLSARPTSGPSAEATRKVTGDREVVSMTVPVRAASDGVSFVLVRARVGDEGDAVVVPIVTRTRGTNRLVLAAAPGWEARAAGEALAKRGEVVRLTRVGATANLSRGATPPTSADPLDRLSGDLSTVDLLVLAGFGGEELSSKATRLERYVRDGGAILFLGEPPRLPGLPLPTVAAESAEENSLPTRVTGTLGDRRVTFLGFGAWKASLPVAGLVLGRLGHAPWIVGRSVGRGRIAAMTAPDAWRTGRDYATVLGDVVGWLEANRAGSGAALSPDYRSLSLGGQRVSLPASGIGGFAVDAVDPAALLPAGRARARTEAARLRRPFLETDTGEELTTMLARFPQPGPLPRTLSARDLDSVWLALAALLVLEVAIRRRPAGAAT